MRKTGLPTRDLNDAVVFPGVSTVCPDNFLLGRTGAEYLLANGHRSFGFCGFKNVDWAVERREGFVRRLSSAGLGCTTFESEYPREAGPASAEQQVLALTSWLNRPNRPTAVMACSDLLASQVTAAAQALELRIPEEIAVLGANNETRRCELASPQLSSVAHDAFHCGFQAAEMLAQNFRASGHKYTVQRVAPRGVIARHSTDMLAVDDKKVAAALGHIQEHACRGVSVVEMARYTGVSRVQLDRRFRRTLGRTAHAEIRRVQIARIRQLLSETDLPLKQIADQTGFEHAEYMCVVYKRVTGETPGAFRRRHAVAC